MDRKDHVLATEPKKDENQQKSEDQRHRPKEKDRKIQDEAKGMALTKPRSDSPDKQLTRSQKDQKRGIPKDQKTRQPKGKRARSKACQKARKTNLPRNDGSHKETESGTYIGQA